MKTGGRPAGRRTKFPQSAHLPDKGVECDFIYIEVSESPYILPVDNHCNMKLEMLCMMQRRKLISRAYLMSNDIDLESNDFDLEE